MAGYDPTQAFDALGVSPNPVGAMDELESHGLPTRKFRSCSEPSFDGLNVGCPFWHECSMSYKGLPSTEGGGPRNHCWERIKSPAQGGGIIRNVFPCFLGVSQQEAAAENKEVLRVIADEGEEYETLTTIPDVAKGADQNGFKVWEKRLVKANVQPFVRLGNQEQLAQHELRASIMQREKENVRRERERKAIGVEGTTTPLDKRGRGSSQGKGA